MGRFFDIQLLGGDKLMRRMRQIQEQMGTELEAALFKAGLVTESEAKKSILQGSKTGRVYKRRTVTHRASAPGQAPASDTGRLANSIHTTVEDGGKQVTVHAGGGIANYAIALEKGTSKMEERPFMRPAAQKGREALRDDLKGLMERVK